jgi:hypothetical protein
MTRRHQGLGGPSQKQQPAGDAWPNRRRRTTTIRKRALPLRQLWAFDDDALSRSGTDSPYRPLPLRSAGLTTQTPGQRPSHTISVRCAPSSQCRSRVPRESPGLGCCRSQAEISFPVMATLAKPGKSKSKRREAPHIAVGFCQTKPNREARRVGRNACGLAPELAQSEFLCQSKISGHRAPCFPLFSNSNSATILSSFR